ncbi:hypothetical protein [Streptomyces mirabilis]|uniref:hypothetical protein n=1 Tax=Streptomyces mirabilis TaxID=68239 RepID=UPI003697E988
MQLPRDPSNAAHALVAAFPTRLAGDVQSVLAVMPEASYAPMMPFEVEVQGETVVIPSRIYNEEPDTGFERALSGTQQMILHCLYSRHHDGRVRQRHLEQITASGEPWAVPFVVQLAGEYVLEIIESIERGLPGLAERTARAASRDQELYFPAWSRRTRQPTQSRASTKNTATVAKHSASTACRPGDWSKRLLLLSQNTNATTANASGISQPLSLMCGSRGRR